MIEDPFIIYCDGFCEPNPGGVATYGWIAKRGDEKIHSHCDTACSGPDANSSIAEYRAVISALEWLLESNYSDQMVVIRSDSQQIVYQIKGSYKVRPQELIPLYEMVILLIKHFKGLEFEWIPREQNKEADKLAFKAYRGTLSARRCFRKRKALKMASSVIPRPDGFFDVPSQHKPDVTYCVDLVNNTCTCPDFLEVGGEIGFCKHIWAVRISSGQEVNDIA